MADVPGLTDEITQLSKENRKLRALLTKSSSPTLNYSGLSFEELKTLLERYGLLDNFVKNGRAIRSLSKRKLLPSVIVPKDLDRLLRHRLIDTSPTGIMYLTDDGVSFLNRCDYVSLEDRREE